MTDMSPIMDAVSGMKRDGKSVEEVLTFLAKERVHIADAVKTIKVQFELTLAEAKMAVARCSLWLEAVENNQPLHDDIVRNISARS